MYPVAVAYIRRSVARTGDPGDVSREFQIEKVRALANGDGPGLRIIDQDWGRSAATDKTDKRLAFLGLLEAVERGEVSTIYAYSTDRLARSVQWAARLLDASERAGTTIVTGEGRFAPGDDGARTLFQVLAVMNENALRNMTTKSKATATKRKERGDHVGRAPYGYRHAIVDGASKLVPREGEDPSHVVDAFVRAGSYLGAARTLNEEGFPTRFTGKAWDPSTVRHVVLRERPELVPVRTRRGATARPPRLFAGLLRCPHADEHPNTPGILTSMPTKWGVRYYCRTAHYDPTHARPYIVSERTILAWARDEVARFGRELHVDYQDVQAGATATLAALEARRQRVVEAYIDGDIDRAEKTRRLAAIDAELPAVESTRRVSRFTLRGKVDWNADPATVNGELRNLWQYIELGADMQPVRAVYSPGMDPDAYLAAQEAQDAAAEAALAEEGR